MTNILPEQVGIIAAGYIFLPLTSGLVFRSLVARQQSGEGFDETTTAGCDVGGLIGKCENLIILTFVLAEAYTGLALIFAAKPIARAEQFKDEPAYYLAGTMVNFTYSLLVAFLIQQTIHIY